MQIVQGEKLILHVNSDPVQNILSKSAVTASIPKVPLGPQEEQHPDFWFTGCPRIFTVGGLALFIAG